MSVEVSIWIETRRVDECGSEHMDRDRAVSYTHLTLPTKIGV